MYKIAEITGTMTDADFEGRQVHDDTTFIELIIRGKQDDGIRCEVRYDEESEGHPGRMVLREVIQPEYCSFAREQVRDDTHGLGTITDGPSTEYVLSDDGLSSLQEDSRQVSGQ